MERGGSEFIRNVESEHEIDPALIAGIDRIIDSYLTDTRAPRNRHELSAADVNNVSRMLYESSGKTDLDPRIREEVSKIIEQKLEERLDR